MIGHGMIVTLRLFIGASYAVTLMAFLGIAAGFVTATITSDTQRSLQVAIGIFALTGALLTIRLWRMTRRFAPPPVDPA
jgi:membrane protein DedA with SNARE-associated domain